MWKSQRKSCWVSSAALPRRCSAFSKEQFALINESFQQTFLELFGGGQARLELEDEKISELRHRDQGATSRQNAEKRSHCSPAAKKAFVAIALYFAICKCTQRRFA